MENTENIEKMDLKNKVVLVTGSSRGIGKEIARKFGENGCRVVINGGKNKEDLLNTKNEFIDENINVFDIFADVSNYEECKKMVEDISNKWGDIDILIHNAGVSHIGLFTDMSEAEYRRMMDINIFSAFHLTHLVTPQMVRNKSGSIIFISSIWGNDGASCEAVYSASKGAMNSFSKAMSKELGASNIRVNTISCGAINTEMNNDLTDDEKYEFAEDISLMRFGEPQEVAELALFLGSDKSSYITGQIITIDGGM